MLGGLPGRPFRVHHSRMIKRARFVAVLAVAASAPAACVTNDVTGPDIPSNAIVYVFGVRTLPLLTYTYVDTSRGLSVHQRWLTDVVFPGTTVGYVGVSCIGLVPHASADTFGTFVFQNVGANVGRLQRIEGATTDTVPVSFLPGVKQGTHGSYSLDTASGALKLLWADGTPTQYFDPRAAIRLINDSITSRAELSAFADSQHVSWRVTWAHESLCQP